MKKTREDLAIAAHEAGEQVGNLTPEDTVTIPAKLFARVLTLAQLLDKEFSGHTSLYKELRATVNPKARVVHGAEHKPRQIGECQLAQRQVDVTADENSVRLMKLLSERGHEDVITWLAGTFATYLRAETSLFGEPVLASAINYEVANGKTVVTFNLVDRDDRAVVNGVCVTVDSATTADATATVIDVPSMFAIAVSGVYATPEQYDSFVARASKLVGIGVVKADCDTCGAEFESSRELLNHCNELGHESFAKMFKKFTTRD